MIILVIGLFQIIFDIPPIMEGTSGIGGKMDNRNSHMGVNPKKSTSRFGVNLFFPAGIHQKIPEIEGFSAFSNQKWQKYNFLQGAISKIDVPCSLHALQQEF